MRLAALLTPLMLQLGLAPGAAAASPPAPPPAGAQTVEFFEKQVRPVLAEHCVSCHGEERQKGGLRLDTRAFLLQGGDEGPVVTAGDPEKSSLIRAVRYSGETKMPPKQQLPPQAIEALATWVKMGVPWPDDRTVRTAPAATQDDAPPWKKHWAFQPVHTPAVPAAKLAAWSTSPIDAFILARLEEKGLTPAPPADRRTLLRRATFDLTGLPPTAQEVAAFEADPAPDAFAKVVDRLLASPRYGERWGRYWLDVARYADTKGYVFTDEPRFACSYSYRDYVIRAFNENLPYDRFIVEQLAADRLPLGDDPRPLAALGFLTLGGRFMNNPHDIIDDRIDVVCRGLLGLTVTCARCHDHKFDPIPTRDYYSLYGVFAGSVEPKALPVIVAPERRAAYADYEKELQAREQKLREAVEAKHAELTADFRARAADYLLKAEQRLHQPSTEGFMFVTQDKELSPPVVQRWQRLLTATRKGHHAVLAPWHDFAALPPKEFAAKAPALAARWAANADPKKRLNPLVARAFAGKTPASLAEVAERYGQLFAEVDRLWQDTVRQASETKQPSPSKLAGASQEQIRQLLYGADAPPNVPLANLDAVLDRASRDRLRKLRKEVEHFQGTSKAAPPRAMVLQDAPTPYEPRVFIRGNPNKPGDPVPRQFLQVAAGQHRQPFRQGSGRLDLAEAIVQKDNPLTARVLVNRLWLHHFGAGLVRTPSDFGLRSEPPTHPELLDYLAGRFVESGWSVKKMQRLIMLSSVYQQQSGDRAECLPLDPENRLLWKMNRRRLDFEALRDSLLAVSGYLDGTMGGMAIDLAAAPFTGRRTVYGFIDRQNLPGMFRNFDFPNPDTTSPQRYETTVPLQALFLMNSPFVVEQARRLVSRPEVAAVMGDEPRVRALYRLAYGRTPDAEELALALPFLRQRTPPAGALTPLEQLAQVLLLANEFAFID